MAERESKRRGRPRKSGSQPAQQPAGASEVAQPTVLVVPEVNVSEIVETTTHTFLRKLYKDGLGGAELDAAYLGANDNLSQLSDPSSSFRTLHLLSGLVVREANERGDSALAEKFGNRQRQFKSVFDRLSPVQGAASGATDPSNLPPMTGRKG